MSNGNSGETPYYSTINAMWPDLWSGQTQLATPRNGVNRHTGRLLQGWDHVDQSLWVLFGTPFHRRVLRRWVGSFVPVILGRSIINRVITRFFWSIHCAIDLYEPCYRIRQVYFMDAALRAAQPPPDGQYSGRDLLRLGQAIFRTEGVYYPRGHLGDYTSSNAQDHQVQL